MALKTFVKISGVNNLSDARYCAGMDVNQLGFNIEPDNSNFTDKEKFKEISQWLSGVEFVGEIENASTLNISEIVDGYDLDAIQVSSKEQVPLAQETGLPVILRIDMAMITEGIMKYLSSSISYFLIESFYQSAISPDLLALSNTYPMVMGFGIDDNNVNQIIESSSIKGIALKGGDEIKPGLKDFNEMADILEAVEIDDTIE